MDRGDIRCQTMEMSGECGHSECNPGCGRTYSSDFSYNSEETRMNDYPKVVGGRDLTDDEKIKQGFIKIRLDAWYRPSTGVYIIEFPDDPCTSCQTTKNYAENDKKGT